MNDLTLYTNFRDEIDHLLFMNSDQYGSLEGLNSNVIGRLFVAVVDTFGGLMRTFATNLSRCTLSVKRSELNEFCSSNMLKVRTVDKMAYENLIDHQIDIPANMSGTYKKVVSNLLDVYTRLNALNNGKLASTSFIEILKSINTHDKKLSSQIDSASRIITTCVNSSKPAIDASMKNFGGKFSYKLPFSKVFLSMQEWQDVRKMLLSSEHRLQDVKAMTELVSSMEASLKSISESIEANDTIVTAKDLQNLSEAAKGIALLFDAYGATATRQIAIEHNYVLIVNDLYDNVK